MLSNTQTQHASAVRAIRRAPRVRVPAPPNALHAPITVAHSRVALRPSRQSLTEARAFHRALWANMPTTRLSASHATQHALPAVGQPTETALTTLLAPPSTILTAAQEHGDWVDGAFCHAKMASTLCPEVLNVLTARTLTAQLAIPMTARSASVASRRGFDQPSMGNHAWKLAHQARIKIQLVAARVVAAIVRTATALATLLACHAIGNFHSGSTAHVSPAAQVATHLMVTSLALAARLHVQSAHLPIVLPPAKHVVHSQIPLSSPVKHASLSAPKDIMATENWVDACRVHKAVQRAAVLSNARHVTSDWSCLPVLARRRRWCRAFLAGRMLLSQAATRRSTLQMRLSRPQPAAS